MTFGNVSAETVLIVDDEEPVRKTFREWLEGARLGCQILAAPDAESALRLANEHTIDLAILDWNLGAGNDGLQLLEDLTLFNPDIVAIMVTGFAHQATPLAAMRMGVRDYLDKNQDLDRTTFLAAVQKQLGKIRPARLQRRLHQQLVAFRSAVEKVLPLVQASAALHDPVPLPHAVGSLFRFLVRTTGARDGILLVRHYDPARQPAEVIRVYDDAGRVVEGPLAPFARSVAGCVLSLREASVMNGLETETGSNLELHPFERGKRALLAAPLDVGPAVQAVLELFDKEGGFGEEDRRLASAAAEFGAEMLRQALAERQTHRVLFDAVEAALKASETMAESLRPGGGPRPEDPPPSAVIEQLQRGLRETPDDLGVDAEGTVRLAEAIRVLALRHGQPAVRHCTRLLEGLREVLDEVTGLGEGAP
jgi:two-component system nitrogen regulation response regulator NtrX